MASFDAVHTMAKKLAAEAASAIVASQSQIEDSQLLTRFQQLIKKWEEQRGEAARFDPTEILCEMGDILQQGYDLYLSKDPDPFEDRHPSRIDPECVFGQILKSFFKKEPLVADVLTNYLRDNYFTRLGQSKSSFDLNVAACRVFIGILPGLKRDELTETEGLVKHLYDWAFDAPEPLQSYATGLLGVCMDVQDIATEPEHRARNDKLIPIVIKRLRAFKAEAESERAKKSSGFKRPFKVFASSSATGDHPNPSKHLKLEASPTRRMSLDSDDGSASLKAEAGFQNVASPSYGEWSNSSWAELESQMIGHFPIHPLTLSVKQVFALRYLAPLAEYQEFLQHAMNFNIFDLLSGLVNLRDTKEPMLAFEAIKFLNAMFCHKKIVLEWVQGGGVQLLLDVPRPSIAATAVSQALYYISCDEDSMEKVCQLPQSILQKMMRYILWLLECSHESGKSFAVNFVASASCFKTILDIFDEMDGIRRLYNLISTLGILATENTVVDILSDDEEYSQRQCIRTVMVCLKRYVEAHLAVKVGHLRRQQQIRSGSQPGGHPYYKPYKLSGQQVVEHIETMLELMPFRQRWTAIENFVTLGIVTKCFQVIANAIDWTFQGRSEMVKSALDILAICSISPRAQLQFCDRVELPDTNVLAFNILLGAAEGDIVQDAADVQRAALHVIINCVCAPINRASRITGSAMTPSAKKRPTGKTSEDLIKKVWDCVRSNNGIMTLLQLLYAKTPITDADSIRALACRALVGLARSEAARQIMSKLPIFTNGELQQLVREPVLHDKRAEHVKFQQYALELTKSVSAPVGRSRLPGENDYSLDMIHRASVVAQTKINFPRKQLLQLIQEYLSSEGLSKSASILRKEAGLAIMTAKQAQLTHKGTTTTPMQNGSLENLSTSAASGQTTPLKLNINKMPLSRAMSSTLSPRSSYHHVNHNHHNKEIHAASAPTTPTSSASSSKIVRTKLVLNTPISSMAANPAAGSTSSLTGSASFQKSYAVKNFNEFTEAAGDMGSSNKINLVSIVSDYLSAQHALCKNPMATCPEFDLLVHHKCPDPRPKASAPWNFTTRFVRREGVLPPFGGPDGRKLDRKLVYSRFRPVKSLRATEEAVENPFYSCLIMPPDDEFVIAGTYMGDVKMYNRKTGLEESTYGCHDSHVTNLQVNREGSLLLTSSPWRPPYSVLWSLGEFFESKIKFKDDDYAEFSKLSQDKIIGTQNRVAKIYDVATGTELCSLKPTISNDYTKNRATFDSSDDLVLNDGVLFDLRMRREIRKLDKLNTTLNGVFHPNNLEIISNSEVWDIRTFHLLKTVNGLENCTLKFSNNGDIIYAVTMAQETEDDDDKYESAFKTFDAHDYSNIATIETRRGVFDLSTSSMDLQIAVVENSLSPLVGEPSTVRLYDVGRLRADEEDLDDGDDDDGDDGDDDEDDEDDEDEELDRFFEDEDEDEGDEGSDEVLWSEGSDDDEAPQEGDEEEEEDSDSNSNSSLSTNENENEPEIEQEEQQPDQNQNNPDNNNDDDDWEDIDEEEEDA